MLLSIIIFLLIVGVIASFANDFASGAEHSENIVQVNSIYLEINDKYLSSKNLPDTYYYDFDLTNYKCDILPYESYSVVKVNDYNRRLDFKVSESNLSCSNIIVGENYE